MWTMFDIKALALFGMPGGGEWIVVLVVALLIFGRRLPEVGKSLGKGIVEFKKGLKGVEDEISGVDDEIDEAASKQSTKKQIASDAGVHTNATEKTADKTEA